ncbi:DUF1178 family protein [Aliisedimentitalea scapharcae]|uniref:DUF1178 family protein n=1 Tax=Aliisedimentitalea scapharcae TaxID=1524259 RepID=A0ABZ2XZA1_9RHOB
MIQYALKCADGHSFDSWFQSAAAYDKLAKAGMVSCAVCGSSTVEKAIMTPRVRPARSATSGIGDAGQGTAPTAPPVPDTPAKPAGPLSAPASAAEQAVADMRRKVEENSDYVGKNFVNEARAMHLGDSPERSIYGEAKLDDAKALIEEGVPVMPLPFMPNRKTN